MDITVENQKKSQGLIWKVLSVGIPCLLMAISYGGLFEFRDVCHGVAYGFLLSHDKRMPSVECRENCEASENYHLNVARHAFSCSMRFRSHFDPFGGLECTLCRRRIKCLDVSVLSDVRFSNMGTEWGGYHLHLLFESLLYHLFVLL